MIDKYLAQETDKLSQRFLDGAKTLDEWQSKLPRLRQEYLYMLGLSPLPEKTPLHATITGTVEHDNVIIDKLHFQSRPGLYVTGNLYRPKPNTNPRGGRQPPEQKRPQKRAAILYVCGHSGKGRDGNKTAFQEHGMWFASNGYICLVIDTLQLGEIPGIHHGTYREGRWWWQARGYTPAGVECWNGIRAIDYLTSRPDVDPERIGVTGISGGGAATIWIAAADERVKCAVPVSGMSDLESYVKNKIINHHCDCMLLINTYGWEWTTIAALIAPRPMLFCNSDNDTIFPMDANRRIADRLRKLYKMYDKPELFDDYVSKGGHDYRPDLRVAVFKWINKHLKNDATPVKDADFKPLPGKDLRVFAEDKDIPKDAINSKIDETFVPKAQVKLPEKGDFEAWKRKLVSEHKEGIPPLEKTMLRLNFEEWKRQLLKELRDKSFRALPAIIPAAEPGQARKGWWGEWVTNSFFTESPIEVLAFGGMGTSDFLVVEGPSRLFFDAKNLLALPLFCVSTVGWMGSSLGQGPFLAASALIPGRTDLLGARNLNLPQSKRVPLRVYQGFGPGFTKFVPVPVNGSSLYPRGLPNQWTKKSPPNYVERAHALLGRPVDEGRLFDVLSFARYVTIDQRGRRKSLTVIGMGQDGILGAYAAIFDSNIKEVIIYDPPVSHRDGPIFLNVMRILDIPEALGLLAPRPLTLINAKDKAFDRTAEIYKLAGAADKFQRK
jgi:dienelactone hydrolase